MSTPGSVGAPGSAGGGQGAETRPDAAVEAVEAAAGVAAAGAAQHAAQEAGTGAPVAPGPAEEVPGKHGERDHDRDHGHDHNHNHGEDSDHGDGRQHETDPGRGDGAEDDDASPLEFLTHAISANFRRAIYATVLACAGLALTYSSGGVLGQSSEVPIAYFARHRQLGITAACVGAALFLLFGLTAVRSATKEILKTIPPGLGDHRKNGLRWFCLLLGYLLVILGTLGALNVPVERLLVGGAVTGVILGIAAQQSLGNLFAGLMLLLTRPFSIGDEVSLRSGPLGGMLTGLVADMNLTYVKLVTDKGTVLLPNSTILSASIGPPGVFDP